MVVKIEILFGPLHRSSPFIGELRCQAIQMEHEMSMVGTGLEAILYRKTSLIRQFFCSQHINMSQREPAVLYVIYENKFFVDILIPKA
jgi:hypothetical protein